MEMGALDGNASETGRFRVAPMQPEVSYRRGRPEVGESQTVLELLRLADSCVPLWAADKMAE
jgi:hypothetical protein